ncbi:thymidine phosphorylase family protein [Pseudomonas sp. SK3(2021)]|uniref:thymidine phosphorylase family protein n=1 Tax=Pseudomonas sp. SK3(2021) TaxID=2841064 RepID=UPI00192C74AE|nr:thymidine phosphorylase family protein [Pseudomonas sp. SK3(2021)]QQZ39461.1 thymidine phosphorylase family protein [Pseudomonas sp. SK3(2021)]
MPTHSVLELRVRRLGIDTHQQPVAFMPRDCHVCRSEGFAALSRIELIHGAHRVIATLMVVDGHWMGSGEVGLSESAWHLLGAQEGDNVAVHHPAPVESMSAVRRKIYGRALSRQALAAIVRDIDAGRFSDVELAAFLSGCAGSELSLTEISHLTEAMVAVGERLHWDRPLVLDKHCVGGLPGNRTTPIVVAIVAANGVCIPKTSSRAITSPAGTADAMEMLAPVVLDLPAMRRVVEQEGGCVVWGGAVNLSPIDDVLIRVERALDLDSEGQLVASVLSKKLAAGASHALIDIPVGATAKVRDLPAAMRLQTLLVEVGRRLGLDVRVHVSNGEGPVGQGIGPALEARDVLAVLHGAAQAPLDLRRRALDLAGLLLEMAGKAPPGGGYALAEATLASGTAWRKFQAIALAQGELREPPQARYRQPVLAKRGGRVGRIDNRILARIGKLAGAPAAPAAGLVLGAALGQRVETDQLLFTVHAETPGELAYALEYADRHPEFFFVEEDEA